MTSGLVAFGIGKIDSRTEAWKLLFIILGAVTVTYGVLLIIILPDSPSKAWFLSVEDKKIALHRISGNQSGNVHEEKFSFDQMWQALKEPQAWLLVVYSLCQNIPNGGLGSVCFFNLAPTNFTRLTLLRHGSLTASSSQALDLVTWNHCF
jgi:hypothetical protein